MNESKRARVTHQLEIVEGRISQDSEPKRGSEITHRLESAERATSQDSERKRGNKGDSPTGYRRKTNREKASDRGGESA
jgi:hypothetical protein